MSLASVGPLVLSLGAMVMTAPPEVAAGAVIELPAPRRDGEVSIEAAIAGRRSVRSYAAGALTLAELGQLLWAAQGETGHARRAAPSAGALHPLEIYVIARRVNRLAAGVYKYRSASHALAHVADGDRLRELMRAAGGQRWVGDGAVAIVIAAVHERTARKYGARARRYVHMEVGCAAENVYLQAAALGLGTVMVGAFDDDRVRDVVGMEPGERPLAILPVGRR